MCSKSHIKPSLEKREKVVTPKGIEPASPAQEGRASSIQPLGLNRREDNILMVSILPHNFRNSSQLQIMIITTFKKFEPLRFWFLTEEIQYHDGLRSRELGQAPILLCAPIS